MTRKLFEFVREMRLLNQNANLTASPIAPKTGVVLLLPSAYQLMLQRENI
jgi:hypothetical protein